MINIFEKVCKTEETPYGIKKVDDDVDLFKKGPCIITILPCPRNVIDINGSLRQVANLVNPDIDTNYDPDRRILGIGYGDLVKGPIERFTRLRPTDEEIDDFIDTFLFSLYTKNGSKLDVLDAMKNFRNITVVTYCDGSRRFEAIEDGLKRKLSFIGYTDADIRLILSQICLAAVSGDSLAQRGTSALTIAFGDVNDPDYESTSGKVIEGIEELGSGFINYDPIIGFAVSGDGEHGFKKHMTEDPILSEKIRLFLNASLDNAIENKTNIILNPITYEKIERALNNNSKSM